MHATKLHFSIQKKCKLFFTKSKLHFSEIGLDVQKPLTSDIPVFLESITPLAQIISSQKTRQTLGQQQCLRNITKLYKYYMFNSLCPIINCNCHEMVKPPD